MRSALAAALLLFTGCAAAAAQQPAPDLEFDAVEHEGVLGVAPTTTPVAHAPIQAHGFTLYLRAGDMIRFAPSGAADERVTARVTSVHPQWVAYAVPGDESRVLAQRLEAFQGMQISRRSRSRSARWGAAWGAYLGGALGAIAGPVSAVSLNRSVSSSMILLGSSGGVVGAAAGALVGAMLAPERWRAFRLTREL